MSAAAWVERALKTELTEFQKKAVNLICAAMRCGPYDFSRTFEKADWNFGRGVRFVVPARGGLSTFDTDGLTALVIGAHDECIRVEIDACSFRHLAIIMHPREREGDIYRRHPTIEDAIAIRRRSA